MNEEQILTEADKCYLVIRDSLPKLNSRMEVAFFTDRLASLITMHMYVGESKFLSEMLKKRLDGIKNES